MAREGTTPRGKTRAIGGDSRMPSDDETQLFKYCVDFGSVLDAGADVLAEAICIAQEQPPPGMGKIAHPALP